VLEFLELFHVITTFSSLQPTTRREIGLEADDMNSTVDRRSDELTPANAGPGGNPNASILDPQFHGQAHSAYSTSRGDEGPLKRETKDNNGYSNEDDDDDKKSITIG
jgi:hypothetical protein